MPTRPTPNPDFPNYDENGVDLSLIRLNLRLTPVERLRQCDRAARGVRRLHELARKQWREQR